MVFNNIQLAVDIKVQDRLREWFSKRGSLNDLQITCVSLGDSDVDYEMSYQAENIKVLNAPFQVPQIKSRLIYTGSSSNLTGQITTFLRRVDKNGFVSSTYSYPPTTAYTSGLNPPTLLNGYNNNYISFNTGLSDAEGFIVYLQTLPDNFFSNSTPQRLSEEHIVTVTGLPVGWEMTIDQANSSFLLAKPSSYSFVGSLGVITITGSISAITKTINFNI